MAMLVKHILRHPSGRVSFRRQYPPELRQFIAGPGASGPTVLKVSLGKEGSPGFLSRYEAAQNRWEATVSLARRQALGDYDAIDAPLIAEVVETYRAAELNADSMRRWDREAKDRALQVGEAMERAGIALPPTTTDRAGHWTRSVRVAASVVAEAGRALRANGDLEGIVEVWRTTAIATAEKRGRLIDTRAPAFERLCVALNDAAVSVHEDMLRRLDGEFVPTPSEPSPRPAGSPPDRLRAPGSRVPLLSLYDAYAAANEGMTAGVRDEWRKYIERLIDFLGHDDAARLTADNLRAWRDKLLAEPTRQGKQRSPVTVRDKYITAVRAALGYAVDEGLLNENVASAVKVKQPKRVKLRERSFTPVEAQAILTAALAPPPARMSTEHARARRWVPWLCAYTGARVGEIAQLRGEDVQELEGVWCLRITPEAGRVKTKEARIVPVHSHLIAQGFLDIVRANGAGPLFYDPSRQRVASESNRHVKKVGERLAEWVRVDVGITDLGLQPNHGWRHLFKSTSYAVGMEERMADAIQGHSAGTTGRKYGAPPIGAKADAIALLPRFQVPGV
ncbi:tyrosine-type recombinase/integrase [Sphingomonas mucosissima]|uniref:Phage integrase family protein n=1 Tax=Sphingomonas mucosissima TaxID=370959 RepID=A0A245ZPX2_9SPHN|nr:tyrosine-type recombinase/integrase [Sphingomonas mucosissima]OWK31793.1 phage integrase family protein [Sphingomonas mucosissima]